MGEFVSSALVLIFSYVMGSIPWGLVIVWLFNGRDIRKIASGRTGGTNALRAAGLLAGFLTATLDVLKGAATAWVVSWLRPDVTWLQVGAAILAVVGHNFSVFLIEKNSKGKLRLRGGAGGATALGGAIALWPQIGMIILPLAALVYILIGYASITTISITVVSIVVFAYRAYLGMSPAEYVVYGVLALLIVLYALRPNLERLANGTERPVGLRAFLLKKQGKSIQD